MKRILAVLVLACMMLSLASCGGAGPEKTAEKYVDALMDANYKKVSKYSVVDFQDVFDAMIAEMMEAEEISKKEALEDLSDTLDAKIKNYGDYVDYMKDTQKEAMKEEFGDKYDIEVSAVASMTLEPADAYAAIKKCSDSYDNAGVIASESVNFAKVKECCKVTVKVYIYEKDSDVFSTSEDFELTMVKISGKWLVLDVPMMF